MDREELLKQEQLINIDGQWFQRGNMSRSWLAVASHPDGSCQGGICERVPSEVWPILEEVVYLRSLLSLLTEQDGMAKEPTKDDTTEESGTDEGRPISNRLLAQDRFEYKSFPAFGAHPVNNEDYEEEDELANRISKEGWEIVKIIPGRDHQTEEYRTPMTFFCRRRAN